MIKKTENMKGITLIALVITIIVLLILAGVTISSVIGDNGILSKARLAKQRTEEARIEEENDIANLENKLNSTNQRDYGIDTLTNETTLAELMDKTDNIDYILANYTQYKNDLVNNEVFLKTLSSNEYALNKMISNREWREAILENDNAIAILDTTNPITIPKMTSDTSPSGTAYATTFYDGDYAAWRAFDGSYTYCWDPGAGTLYKEQYIMYSFENPVWVYKMYINTRYQGNTSWIGKEKMHMILEATNNKDDSNSWVAISDEFYEGELTLVTNSNCNQKFKHYRVRITKTDGDSNQNGSGNSGITVLQLYGK